MRLALLVQVLKLPYVQQNLDRFKADEQRRNFKQSTSMARRKQLLESHVAHSGGGEGDAGLTPKERMARKREQERERRELEMKLAAMSATKNREQASGGTRPWRAAFVPSSLRRTWVAPACGSSDGGSGQPGAPSCP